MRLLVVTNDLSQGGAEKLLVSSLTILKQKQLHVELLLLNAKDSVPDYLVTLRNAGIVIHDLRMASFYSPISIRRIQSFLKLNRFDIVHVHLFPSLYWAAIARLFVNVKPLLVYTEHSTQNKRRSKIYFRPVERLVYKLYSAIIAITENVKQNLDDWTGQGKKITTIQNGVALESIRSANATDRALLCSELGIPSDSKLLLMAASFRYPKDQGTIIKACQLLGNKYHILLAGEGDLLESVRALAVSCNVSEQVHFLGFRTDIAILMKSVDINILSSSYEGMSGVTLESLAAGVPFLGSDVPGIHDIVPNELFLFNPGSEKELSEKILMIFEDAELQKKMVSQATSYVKNFDMELMADKYIALYNTLLAKKHKRIIDNQSV
ncbi:glycosyltransferase [Dyadobacter aurulentus]|uniref:glycosyltransferase n=1 Tax=Dyadobacter sp. UC 10 TaxID=2605428 RepID=UPI0011F0D69B|nr:glycosyltransferase [Dyadobacter sp. UC 10]KAA0991303.1 glycosyltransferase [Dyadobacter sp. UC 10]